MLRECIKSVSKSSNVNTYVLKVTCLLLCVRPVLGNYLSTFHLESPGSVKNHLKATIKVSADNTDDACENFNSSCLFAALNFEI